MTTSLRSCGLRSTSQRTAWVLLDPDLSVRFINETARRLFIVPDQQADSHLPYSLLIGRARTNGMLAMPAGMIEAVIASSIARVRAADPAPQDLRIHDGRHIVAQCTAMPHGGRMLTYRDVSDPVCNTAQFAVGR
jgi:hypothetical protein